LDKSGKDLTLKESALLGVVLPRPLKYTFQTLPVCPEKGIISKEYSQVEKKARELRGPAGTIIKANSRSDQNPFTPSDSTKQ